MSWEAQRLTSRSPSEVYAVLGPHGCDDLIRQAWAACWRAYPEETRSFKAARQRFFEVFSRNMNIWRRIKKPAPDAFFADFNAHDPVEGHIRQALVLSWMMMPRSGGRDFKDTFKIIQRIYDRNVEAWEEDDRTFTTGPKKRPAKRSVKKVTRKSAKRK
ncbi:MAG TPA: hypothetical protein VH475_06275 [Tepidisphaeraceae bacterium]|jgi:hypothetical protein